VPLGSTRFQEIDNQFRTRYASEDEVSEAGEGQRLDIDSSQTGSSGALIGAEATPLRAGPGLVRIASARTLKVATADSESLPSYQQANNKDDEVADGDGDVEPTAPAGAGILDFGNDMGIRRSIEVDDEAVDLTEDNWPKQQPQSWPQQTWNFQDLTSKDQGDRTSRSSDTDSMVATMDIENDTSNAHSGQPPSPDPFNQEQLDKIRNKAWEDKAIVQVQADLGGDESSDKAAVDIHISDDEGLRLD